MRRFYEELRRLGYEEGKNLVVERLSAEGSSSRFNAIAAEIVSRAPDVIVTNFNSLVKALTAATTTIPIVGITGDPLAGGLISNLARPGGNLTGVSIDAGVGIVAKRQQILKEVVPTAAKVAYLFGSRSEEQRLGSAQVGKFLAEVNEAQLRGAFAEMAEQKVDAAIVSESGSFLAWRALIIELAAKHRLPAIYPFRDYAEAGGLVAYAPDLGELAARMASDVHQILNGTKPGEIPYYQPTKFELVINLKTAKALGLAIPSTLLALAHEVIE